MKYIETKTKQRTDNDMELKQPKIQVKIRDETTGVVHCEENLHNPVLHDFFPDQIDLFFVCKDVEWEGRMLLDFHNQDHHNSWRAEYLNVVLSNFTVIHCDMSDHNPFTYGQGGSITDCELKPLDE